MPAGFRRHLVGKTLKNAGYYNTAEIRFIVKLVVVWAFLETDWFKFYVNNSINLRLLAPHIMPSYTHNMAIVS